MRPLVVVEGKTDELILRHVLDADPQLKGRFGTAVGGGRSSAISLARSYLLNRDQHVVLVLDSDTTDVERVAQDQSFLEDLLKAVAHPEQFLVQQMRPEIEALLFSNRNAATRAFRHEFSDREWLSAQQAPKVELSRVLGVTWGNTESLARLKRLLDSMDLRSLAGSDAFKAIGDFILRASPNRVRATG